jgi:hypothetical protein
MWMSGLALSSWALALGTKVVSLLDLPGLLGSMFFPLPLIFDVAGWRQLEFAYASSNPPPRPCLGC